MSLTENDIEPLETLIQRTDNYIQDVFDWISPLREHSLLERLYDFRAVAEKKLNQLKGK